MSGEQRLIVNSQSGLPRLPAYAYAAKKPIEISFQDETRMGQKGMLR